jgi:hypothetical protein
MFERFAREKDILLMSDVIYVCAYLVLIIFQ